MSFRCSHSMYSEHSILLLLGTTQAIIPQAIMLVAAKNTNGMLLFPLASMMAEETKGPMKEEALPMIENNEKKRVSFPRGQTSDIIQPLSDFSGEVTFDRRHRKDK